MNVNFVAAILITSTELRSAWEAAGVAAIACNTFTQERAMVRSNARAETMGRAHSALERLGLSLPSYNRLQSEVFTDFKAGWGEDPYNGFCWSLAEEAIKTRERFMIEQEAEWAAFCLEQESVAIESVNRFKRVHA